MRYVIFFLLIFCFCFTVSVQARTALVEYQYDGATSDTVGILVSGTSGFTQILKDGGTITGAIDIDKDGVVEIGNLIPGTTYYFSAVAWNIDNVMSNFAPEQFYIIPEDIPLIFEEFPSIPIEGKTITFTVEVK